MDIKNIIYLLYFILVLFIRKNQGETVDYHTFPNDFSIGTAISAYQVEGANDRGESVWDRFLHNKNRSNADITIDFYHRYKEDILLLKNLGVNHLRFSLSWSRILPTGYVKSASKSGIKFYHDLLDELEKYNITPIVTLYHFDFPQKLENDMGGWLNESMAYAFADYARFIFEEFGSRIKTFSTINEIFIACKFGYDSGAYAPGVLSKGVGLYMCTQNMLKGHALAYHIYEKEYRHKYKGEIGIVDVCHGYYNEDSNDVEAEHIAHAFDCGLIFHPIFSEKGNFSDTVIRNVAERSQLQGHKTSRLPLLTDEWVEKIRGSSDYLGLNHYSSRLAKTLSRSKMASWENDSGVMEIINPGWPQSIIPVFPIVPAGMGNILRRIKKEYNNPKIYILENGVGLDGELDDKKRIEYLYSYMKEMLIAVKRDKCNVKMYTYWSFLDSFEFLSSCGYYCKFGLVSVDINDKNLTRTMRKSSAWWQYVMEKRQLLPPSSML